MVLPSGQNDWRFERARDPSKHPLWERLAFWLAFPLFIAAWSLLLVVSAALNLDFHYALVCLVSVVVLGVNLVGYILCMRGSVNRAELQSAAGSYITDAVAKEVTRQAFGTGSTGSDRQ